MCELIHWNCNGIGTKNYELSQFVSKLQIQMVILSETHIHRSDIPSGDRDVISAPPRIDGMHSIHVSHTSKSSGVAIYAVNALKCIEIAALSLYHPYTTAALGSSALVVLTAMVLRENGGLQDQPLMITALYIPPSAGRDVVSKAMDLLERAKTMAVQLNIEWVVAGDLNCESASLGGSAINVKGDRRLRNFLTEHLFSANRRFTPQTETHVARRAKSVIDHVLSLHEHTITGMTVVRADDPVNGPEMCPSAHRLLLVQCPSLRAGALRPMNSPATTERDQIPRTLLPRHREAFALRVDALLEEALTRELTTTSDIDIATQLLTEAIRQVARSLRRTSHRKRYDSPSIITPALAKAINGRKKVLARIADCRQNQRQITASLLRAKAQADKVRNAEVAAAKAQRWAEMCSKVVARGHGASVHCDWKSFHRTVGGRRMHLPTSLTAKDARGHDVFLQPKHSIDHFVTQYAKVFTPSQEWSTSTPKTTAQRRVRERLDTLKQLPNICPAISADELAKAMASLPSNRAPGRDGVSNALLKGLGPVATELLRKLIGTMLKAGHVPNAWKTTKCIPLFKGGDPSDWANYRIIALSATLLKLTELIVLNRWKAKEGVDSFYKLQFGFRPQHSTADALQFARQRIAEQVLHSGAVVVAFLDISKAFDCIDPDTTLETLMDADSCPPGLWRWLAAYLHGRAIIVQAGTVTSIDLSTPCGTPQGGVLSPFVFLKVIDELARIIDGCNCDAVLFADDLLIIPRSRSRKEAARDMQRALDAAGQWAARRNLRFNTRKGKSAVIRFRDEEIVSIAYKPLFTLAGEPLQYEEAYKYLGVWFDETLTFGKHMQAAVTNLHTALAAIKRLLVPKAEVPPKIIRTLLLAFAVPTITYGSHIVQYTKQTLKKAQQAIGWLLCKTLGLPYTAHRNSLLVEFAIPPLHMLLERTAANYHARLQKCRNAVGRMTRSDAKKGKGPPPNLASAVESASLGGWEQQLYQQWVGHRWGQPLKQVHNLCASTPFTGPPAYFSLPHSVAIQIASVRFDTFSFWRKFKESKRNSMQCGWCGHQIGDAYHLTTQCQHRDVVAARGLLYPQTIVDPAPHAWAEVVRFIAFLQNGVKNR